MQKIADSRKDLRPSSPVPSLCSLGNKRPTEQKRLAQGHTMGRASRAKTFFLTRSCQVCIWSFTPPLPGTSELSVSFFSEVNLINLFTLKGSESL